MPVNASDISSVIKKQIREYNKSTTSKEYGEVITVGDGVATVYGIHGAEYGELLIFNGDKSSIGMVMDLRDDYTGVVILSNNTIIGEGDKVERTKMVAEVGVGDELLGRVVNGLGIPIDGRALRTKVSSKIFSAAPGVMKRHEVNKPLETGILAIDSLVPIGRGQRELIIGDRQTGKTSIAIDAIVNQKGKNVKCVYVAIGQKNSTVAQIVDKLKNLGALEYTTIVVSGAAEIAPLQYLAPYTGVTIAERWMNEGKNVLIVYDDLSKHAVAYRTLSLLLRRPPGREAYPGDIFYQHSYLLERAAKLSDEFGGGSITALPIIETQAGDISAYIPTNVISITDGQIFTKESLFNSGQRPAVDVGFSVSRVGSAAQIKAVKKVASSLKLDLAQYNEMLAFAQFGSDLDENTKKILDHGAKVNQMLIQAQYSPLDQVDEAILLFTIKEKIINIIPVEKITSFKNRLLSFASSDSEILAIKHNIRKTGDFVKDDYEKLRKLLIVFTKDYTKTIPHYDSSKFLKIPNSDNIE